MNAIPSINSGCKVCAKDPVTLSPNALSDLHGSRLIAMFASASLGTRGGMGGLSTALGPITQLVQKALPSAESLAKPRVAGLSSFECDGSHIRALKRKRRVPQGLLKSFLLQGRQRPLPSRIEAPH
jgi:hypothetical protein